MKILQKNLLKKLSFKLSNASIGLRGIVPY